MPHYLYRPDHPYANENGFVEANLAGPRHISAGAVNVIRDEMAPTRHMADGKYYTSKAKFREVTKAHGCVEVGSEVETLLKPRKRPELSREQRVRDIQQAVRQLRGY